MNLIDRLWEDSPLFLTKEEFAKSFEGWDIDPVEHSGEIVGAFVVKGPHFHFAKFDSSYQATREILRKYPGELIAKYGYAETQTPKDDLRQRRFNERLGGKIVGETEYDVIYRFDRARY